MSVKSDLESLSCIVVALMDGARVDQKAAIRGKVENLFSSIEESLVVHASLKSLFPDHKISWETHTVHGEEDVKLVIPVENGRSILPKLATALANFVGYEK